MINALAHVIVTEGLVDEAYRRASAAIRTTFAAWKRFVAEPQQLARKPWKPSPACRPSRVRGAARLYATGGNGAIYYGLGVTEHSQGTTTVMGIANLAMATGNLGRRGRRREPAARPEQRAGLLRHGLLPARVRRAIATSPTRAVRGLFEAAWGVTLEPEPGLRIPNMFDAALDGSFKGLYIQGEDIAQSDPNTQHVTAALAAMECVVVQDLFLNETANYAHVFLPGSSFLEKDGTFTNAERRITRVRKVDAAARRAWRTGKPRWRSSNALGYPDELQPSVRDHGRDRAADADLHRRQLCASSTSSAACSGPATMPAPEGTPIMHVDQFVRGKGKFIDHRISCRPTRRTGPRFPLLLTTGRILSQYNVGAQTRRTENVRLARRGRAGDPSARRRGARHPRRRLGRAEQPGRRDGAARDGHRAHAAGRRLHDVPFSRDPAPMSSPPNTPTGRPTARNTR